MPVFDGPAFLLDASTPWLHAGVFLGGDWLTLERAEGDAVTLLPELARRALEKSGLRMRDMRCLIHCEGPGSLLGLRLAAMMMETWRVLPEMAGVPVMAYRSLPVMGAIISRSGPVTDFRVATPFRRGSYSVWSADGVDTVLLDDARMGALQGLVYLIPQRNIKCAPGSVRAVEYDLAQLPVVFAENPELFRRADRAEVYTPLLSEYKLWDGHRHGGA